MTAQILAFPGTSPGLRAYAAAHGMVFLANADQMFDYEKAVAASDLDALAALGLDDDDLAWHAEHPGQRLMVIAP